MLKVISHDRTTIAYDKKGQGPVVILVLGALNKRGSGKKLAELLADRFTVVCYDRRGRGDSTDAEPYFADAEVDDLEALINDLGGSAYLYGHSSGAVLALLAAKRLGSKVTGLALYELPYNAEPEAKVTAEAYRNELRRLLANHNHDGAVSLFVKSVGVTDKQIDAMKRLPMWKGLTAMAPTLAYDTIELMEQYPTIDSGSVEAPALVMYGGASPTFMADTARQLAEVMPNARLLALEGQSHDAKADVLAPVLAEFFTE